MKKRGEIFGMEVWVDPDMAPEDWKLVSPVTETVYVPREPRPRSRLDR